MYDIRRGGVEHGGGRACDGELREVSQPQGFVELRVPLSAPILDSRMVRGQQIAKTESNVRRIDATEYRVRSQSGNGEYTVISTEAGWYCSCPDAGFRGVKCKHAFAVELSLQIRRRIENARRISPLDFQSSLSCGCGSRRVKKDGLLHNKGGPIQRFECLECGKRFTNNLGFERMRSSAKAVTMAMQMYFGGASLRNVQKALALQGVSVNHTTVYRWIQKYVGLMQDYIATMEPNVSDTWRADELWVKVRGDMKYLFAVMDDETRYWIAQEVSNVKQGANADRLFIKAKDIAGKAPKMLITDALPSYMMAAKLNFPHANHLREIALGGKIHNNKMERMNGEVRDREKTMRGLKTKDTPILKGLQIYHNFVRPHMGLDGDTPAERAGIKVEGDDKFLTLIQNAQHQRRNREEAQHQ